MRVALIVLLAAAAAAAQDPRVEVATTVAFTEGPTVDSDGNVYFTETTFNRILKLTRAGKLEVFRENSNGANGMVFDRDGSLIVCEGSDNERRQPRVVRIDMKAGRTETLAEAFGGKPLNRPNDVTVDGKGRVYFTDPGTPQTSQVIRIDGPGQGARILASPQIEKPNGIIISPDDKTLYLVESNGAAGGARMIRAYDLDADGNAGAMRVFHNFSPGRSADGLCIDTAGNVYAVAGLNRRRGTAETLDTRAGVHVLSPQGKLIEFYPLPEDTVTNCAFGGEDMKTLYVTAGKTLYRIRVKIPGTPR